MNPTVREYLLKKRQPSKLTEEDAEDPMTPPEYAPPNPLASDPEGPGMDPSELADYVRTPVTHAAPDYDPVADLKAAQAAAKQDEARRSFLEGTSRINDAFTGSGVQDYGKGHDVADAKDRAQAVREFMLQKYRDRLGSAQEMNARAALNNSVRARQTPVAAKTDPLIEEKRAKLEAETARLKRVPATKPDKFAQKAAQKKAEKEEADAGIAIGDADGEYRLKSGYSAPDKELIKKFTDRVQGARGINKGIDALKSDFRSLTGRAPSKEQISVLRERINSAQYVLGPAINAFLGQGAMGEAEAARAKNALGTMDSLPFMLDAVVNGKTSPSAIEAKLSEVQSVINMMKDEHADTLNFEKRRRGQAPKDIGGEEMVHMLSPDGKSVRVPKSRVQAALAAGGKLP